MKNSQGVNNNNNNNNNNNSNNNNKRITQIKKTDEKNIYLEKNLF